MGRLSNYDEYLEAIYDKMGMRGELIFLKLLREIDSRHKSEDRVEIHKAVLVKKLRIKPSLLEKTLKELAEIVDRLRVDYGKLNLDSGNLIVISSVKALLFKDSLKKSEKKYFTKKEKSVINPRVETENKRKEKLPPLTNGLFEAFSEAYFMRYGIKPVSNAKIRGQMMQLIKQLGQEESIKLAEYYVRHENSFYVRAAHDFGLLLRDSHSLYSQYKRGVQITNADIKRYEKAQETNSMLEAIRRGDLCPKN